MDTAKKLIKNRRIEEFTMSMLNKVLKNMDGNKNGGADDIQIRFLHNLTDLGKQTLLGLINRTYRQGRTPAAWRLAEIVAVDKPGKPGEFRPISLTNVIARCAEKLILAHLSPWAESNLPTQQAGFRKYRSCEGQVASLTEDAATAIQEQQVGVAAFLDYSAAYDRVSIRGLLAQLGKMQCPPHLLLWLQAFLMDRRAYCRWDTEKCKNRVIPHGLPQGSSLAPLLWNLYIADLPEAVSSVKISLFADDTALIKTGPTYKEYRDIIQKAIRQVERYCEAKWIVINPKKTVVLPLGYKPYTPGELSMQVAGAEVQPSQQARFLGVTIDSRLSFATHSQQVASKYKQRSRILSYLAGTSWGATEQVLRTARKALLEPLATYAGPGWIPHASDSSLARIERARNTSLRKQTGCCKSTEVHELRNLTGTSSLRSTAAQSAAILIEKNIRLKLQGDPRDRNRITKLCRQKKKTTVEAAEDVLADKGLLPLPRLKLPTPQQLSNDMAPGMSFHYTNCKKDDCDEDRKQKAMELLNSIPDADLSVWTDGSVGAPSTDHKPAKQLISVRWDDKGYTGWMIPYSEGIETPEYVAEFQSTHYKAPSHIIKYDDGDIKAVQYEQNTASKDETVTDKDKDNLNCRTVPNSSTGRSGFFIQDHRTNAIYTDRRPAGLHCNSYTAEIRAAIHAFKTLLMISISHTRVRWVLDSHSLCRTIQENVNDTNALIQELKSTMRTAVETKKIQVDICWISSHCGVEGNEKADKLAKEALNIPVEV